MQFMCDKWSGLVRFWLPVDWLICIIFLAPDIGTVQFSSVMQSSPTLHDPIRCNTPGFPVHDQLQSLRKLMSIDSVMQSNYLILCHPLLILPSIFPSIRVFSNESVLCIRWPEYWSFSFSISSSTEYSELISLRIDWFDLLLDLVVWYLYGIRV